MASPPTRAKEHTLSHLRECLGELQDIIRQLDADPDYNASRFKVEVTHAYHHLNYAWNSRRLGAKRAWKTSWRDFRRFRQMPKDIELGVPEAI